MAPRNDLTGKTFGRLVVLSYEGRTAARHSLWRCLCACGEETVARGALLKDGRTTSCGCFQREAASSRKRTHGQGGTALYRRWIDMNTRTTNPNHKDYGSYGGRGITVCERWRTFENFAADMGPTFRKELTLERLDVNGPYSPGNCVWATWSEQQRNRRDSVWLEYQGIRMVRSDWAAALGIPGRTLRSRLQRGWPVERALTEGIDPAIYARLKADQERSRCAGTGHDHECED